MNVQRRKDSRATLRCHTECQAPKTTHLLIQNISVLGIMRGPWSAHGSWTKCLLEGKNSLEWKLGERQREPPAVSRQHPHSQAQKPL